jgi:hypothetical protein
LAAAALAFGALGAIPARAADALTTLYSFCAQSSGFTSCADGERPEAGLIADGVGNLFGTTTLVGAHNINGFGGTVFKLAKNASTASGYDSGVTVLYSFCAQSSGSTSCADGARPEAGLIADGVGNLFGTTTLGGAHNINGFGGTVFKLAKNAGTASGYDSAVTALYSSPRAALPVP